ncbi:hypothetical protein CLOM_g8757 [Closterium sp. NIES-68]|nr:hypothetical protein CLOM_g8757 [Closterium sp. NIES-68]GJP85256.1 hypothetical protein CLOP_g15375 [Closterium sp. NIES-67]
MHVKQAQDKAECLAVKVASLQEERQQAEQQRAELERKVAEQQGNIHKLQSFAAETASSSKAQVAKGQEEIAQLRTQLARAAQAALASRQSSSSEADRRVAETKAQLAAVQEKHQRAAEEVKRLQEAAEAEKNKARAAVAQQQQLQSRIATDVAAWTDATNRLQQQVDKLMNDTRALEASVAAVEAVDRWTNHRVKLMQQPQGFTCSACRSYGSGLSWRCLAPHCPDAFHVQCFGMR